MTDTLTGTPALDAVNAALATVQDPEINRPLTELGMVKDVQIGADGSVRVEVYLTVAGCPMRETITTRVTTAVSAVPGVTSVQLLACIDAVFPVFEIVDSRIRDWKIKIADTCRHVSQEAIQLHGGMGMSEELKVSHTFRRLTMIGQQFGDADHHLARFAALG